MVRSIRILSAAVLVLTAAAMGVACQGSDLTLPSDAPSFNLRIVSGDGQQGTVGTELDSALVVGVTDRAGQPVTDISLLFEPKAPGVQVEDEEVTTNENGEAATRVVLGDIEGTHTVEVRLAEMESLKASFTLTAVASEPPEDDDEDGDRGRGRGRGKGGGNGGGGGEGDDDD